MFGHGRLFASLGMLTARGKLQIAALTLGVSQSAWWTIPIRGGVAGSFSAPRWPFSVGVGPPESPRGALDAGRPLTEKLVARDR